MTDSSLVNPVVLQFQEQFQPFYEDLSALALTPDKYLWVASDETTTLERLSFDDEHTFSNHQTFDIEEFIDLPGAKDEEIDIEGLAYADYYLWFIGSHSWKRKKPKQDKSDKKNSKRLAATKSEKNRYLLARIPLIDGHLYRYCPHPDYPDTQLTAANLELTEKGNLLTDGLESDPHIGSFILSGIPGKENGFDIEGLAILNHRIFIGLRGPVLRGWAIILELEIESAGPTLLNLKKIDEENEKVYKKHFVKLGGLGIRDLCFDGQDLLILAGPTMDLDGPVKLFRLEGGFNSQNNMFSWEPKAILDLPYGEGNHHAEGMTLFNSITQQPSILVVYDSPSPTTKVEGVIAVLADIFPLA